MAGDEAFLSELGVTARGERDVARDVELDEQAAELRLRRRVHVAERARDLDGGG